MAAKRIRADDLLRLGCQAVKPVAQVNGTARENTFVPGARLTAFSATTLSPETELLKPP